MNEPVIRTRGDPLLRQIAQPVRHLWTPKLAELVSAMRCAMHVKGGVGIAAPQLGESLRLFIVASRPNERYPDAPLMPPEVIVDPEILWASDDTLTDWEGCLSVPGLRGRVARARRIRVRSLDAENGETRTCDYTDFVARIFQHELDHLDGILFPDRLAEGEELISDDEYQRRIRPQPGVQPGQPCCLRHRAINSDSAPSTERHRKTSLSE